MICFFFHAWGLETFEKCGQRRLRRRSSFYTRALARKRLISLSKNLDYTVRGSQRVNRIRHSESFFFWVAIIVVTHLHCGKNFLYWHLYLANEFIWVIKLKLIWFHQSYLSILKKTYINCTKRSFKL